MKSRKCTKCKWASFPLTKHNPPRIKPHQSGTCGWPLPTVTVSYGVEVTLRRVVIWPDTCGCPVWEAKEVLRADKD